MVQTFVALREFPELKTSIYPPGATNANWFSLFNALSFQITLGSPMILFAKSLGATATVLGVMASLMPLLTVAQIPAAYYLQRVGYRRMVLAGWGARTVFVFLIAGIPLADFLTPVAKIALLLLCLFLFNLLRGFSSGAWLPWLTDLLPENVRGRFLSRDQVFLHVGCLLSVFTAAVMLRSDTEPWRYTVIFLFSALMATVSLVFLRRMPDIEPGEVLSKSNTRVPWRTIVTHPPFLRLVLFTIIFLLGSGSLGVFNVVFMRNRLGFGEDDVLYLSSVFFAGVLVFLPFMGRVTDFAGSKPVLRGSMVLWLVHVLLWGMLAAGWLPPTRWMVGIIIFGAGLAGASFNIAHVRLMMATMPPMGRSHFFAFFSVITSLALGAAPVVWGVVLDALDTVNGSWAGMEINRFTLYYAAVALILATNVFAVSLLEEKETHPASPREVVMKSNLRRLLRGWYK
jgi:MFS family permease